jgi:group II intron reverse transcriptase/maturase
VYEKIRIFTGKPFEEAKGFTLLVLTTLCFLTTRLRRVHFRSSLECSPAQGPPWAFPPTLTTAALYRSSLEWFETFKKVKANQGAAGVDGQSIADFEADLSNNLYKLWNRVSSGSYFPPPVRRVDIPKADGGTRPLGIPTVADRVAQEVARRYLESRLEPVFHADSYGYRPGKSAIDAVRQDRQRCWRYDWVLNLDVKAYFGSIDWELMLKAVQHLIADLEGSSFISRTVTHRRMDRRYS